MQHERQVGRGAQHEAGVRRHVAGDLQPLDVAQQAFERAWTHAAMYDPRRGSVGAWLAGITHNLAVDAVRARRPTPLDPADLDALLDAVTRTPEGDALAPEAARELRTAIAALPPEQTRALVLAAYRGMTAAQVAAAESIHAGHREVPDPGRHAAPARRARRPAGGQ